MPAEFQYLVLRCPVSVDTLFDRPSPPIVDLGGQRPSRAASGEALPAHSAFCSPSTIPRDLYLGLSFGDPSVAELDMTEAVSARVNTNAWHDKVKRNNRYLRSFA